MMMSLITHEVCNIITLLLRTFAVTTTYTYPTFSLARYMFIKLDRVGPVDNRPSTN